MPGFAVDGSDYLRCVGFDGRPSISNGVGAKAPEGIVIQLAKPFKVVEGV